MLFLPRVSLLSLSFDLHLLLVFFVFFVFFVFRYTVVIRRMCVLLMMMRLHVVLLSSQATVILRAEEEKYIYIWQLVKAKCMTKKEMESQMRPERMRSKLKRRGKQEDIP